MYMKNKTKTGFSITIKLTESQKCQFCNLTPKLHTKVWSPTINPHTHRQKHTHTKNSLVSNSFKSSGQKPKEEKTEFEVNDVWFPYNAPEPAVPWSELPVDGSLCVHRSSLPHVSLSELAKALQLFSRETWSISSCKTTGAKQTICYEHADSCWFVLFHCTVYRCNVCWLFFPFYVFRRHEDKQTIYIQ